MEITIYHNPRCSKSRQTLGILREEGVEPTIVEYLKDPPSADRLAQILGMLEAEPRELMREKEKEFRDLDLADISLSRDALIKAMVDNPILIERPIVIRGDKAILGRPPEAVRQIL